MVVQPEGAHRGVGVDHDGEPSPVRRLHVAGERRHPHCPQRALDSFADFVAKRDADAALTAERDELLSRLADVRAELEPWGLERLARRDRTLAEQVHDIRQSWTALRDANRHNVSRADAAEQQLATAHAEHEKSLTDWARAREERDQALRGLADLQRLVAAAEANEPVLVHPDWRQAEIDELTEERDVARDQLAHALAKLTRMVEARDASQGEAAKLRKRCEELADELGRFREPKAATQAYALGRDEERAAIVAMLRNPIWADMPALLISDHIERGEHTWPDVE